MIISPGDLHEKAKRRARKWAVLAFALGFAVGFASSARAGGPTPGGGFGGTKPSGDVTGFLLDKFGNLITTEAQFPAFGVVAQSVSLNGVGTVRAVLSLMNAAGSTATVRIRSIRLVNAQTTAVSGLQTTFFLKRITDHAAGTALTPLPFDTTDALPVAVTARTNSTLTAIAAVPLLPAWRYTSEETSATALTRPESELSSQNAFRLYTPVSGEKPITLLAGEGVALRQETPTGPGNGNFDVWIAFTVE